MKAQIKFPDRLEHASAANYLIDQNQIKGTHWYVSNKTARNSITYNKRYLGMLVTWIESSSFVTGRFEGVNTLDANWQNDANWQKIIAETDTLTYAVYADTSGYSYISQLAYDADTATFAWYSDTTNFSLYADTANYSLYADTSQFSHYSDTSIFSHYSDTSIFSHYSDTSNIALFVDTARYSNITLDCSDLHSYINASLYGTELNCDNAFLSLTGSSNQYGVSYQWYGSVSGNLGSSNPLIATTAETITLTVTNSATGCTDDTTIVLTQNITDPILEKTIASKNINGELLLSVFVTNPEANTEYNYAWTGTGITTDDNIQSIKVNGTGSFTATVTNLNTGCNDNTIVSVDTTDFEIHADTAGVALNANVDSIYFKQTNGFGHLDGTLIYDTTRRSLVFHNDISDFHHNLGYDLVVRVYNESGAQINRGTAVTLDTVYHNGIITPTIKKAGMASRDSLNPVGLTTVDIPNNSYGIVTLFGQIDKLNTDIYGVGDASPLWVGNNGALTAIKPSPPNYALQIGYIFYADNDSGSIYINPLQAELSPQPHFIADTSNISQTVTINTINVYEYLPFSMAQERDNEGFNIVGDSAQVLVEGHYFINLGFSFNGNPTTEIWRYGIFIDGKPVFTKSRSTSSSATGDVNVLSYRHVKKNSWIAFKIRNQSGTGDPTIIDINFSINFRHE